MSFIPADFGVYAFSNFRRSSAQQYYRILLPLRSLNELGLANIYADDGQEDRELAMRIMQASDIALAWNLGQQVGESTADSFNMMEPVKKDGALLFPPSFVFDMDDALEWCSPMSPVYCSYGIRNWSGELLKPGDSISFTRADGQKKILWEDKKSSDKGVVFDIERNHAEVARHYRIAAKAAGVTVTTEPLKELFLENGAKNVYVYPNSIAEEDYFFADIKPWDGIRIFWQGSGTHFEDWMPVAEPLKKVLKENPHVKLVLWGPQFKSIINDLEPDQYLHYKWVDYAAYKQMRHNLGIDINLCPLVDSPFNDCKSAIKWYEASVGPRPEATLAAKVGDYKREIEHGRHGMLYSTPEEFYEYLTALIKNRELRLALGRNAREKVLATRDFRKTGVGLYDFYQEIKRQQRMEALKV